MSNGLVQFFRKLSVNKESFGHLLSVNVSTSLQINEKKNASFIENYLNINNILQTPCAYGKYQFSERKSENIINIVYILLLTYSLLTKYYQFTEKEKHQKISIFC